MLRISHLFFSLVLLSGSGASDILLNGTSVYLATGDSYGLYQGYILSLKSVSEDSVWLQLEEDDKIVKSEIVAKKGNFYYNKSNGTILSAKVDSIYSGSSEQNLVSLFPVYQYLDADKPVPNTTVMPGDTPQQDNDSSPMIRIQTPKETLIWALGIVFILILFYVLRRLW